MKLDIFKEIIEMSNFYDLYNTVWVIQEVGKMRFHLGLTLFTKKKKTKPKTKEVKEAQLNL